MAKPSTHSPVLGTLSPKGKRAIVVWVSLVAAMTAVGGTLLAIDSSPVPRIDGLSLSPLAAAAMDGRGSSDPVFATRAPLAGERWQAIVIHHSGSPSGSPASIEREHLAQKFEGLGHHFIIGNGQGMDDGQLHIGYRWLDQRPGAHVAGENGAFFNQHAISICLVGDGNRQAFSRAQLDRLGELLGTLSRRLNIPRERLYLHSQLAQVSDPGRLFPADVIGVAGTTSR